MTDATQVRLTMQDVLQLDGRDDYQIEVNNSEIIYVERNMTWLHTMVIMNLYDLLKPFLKQNKLGRVFIDGNRYILNGDAEDVQRAYQPDLSFLRAGRISDDFDWNGDFIGAPDLAVEVASRGQGNPYYLKRITHYLEAGVEEVWFIVPWERTLHQYRQDADAPKAFSEQDTLTPSDLFPNLQIPIHTLFNTDG